MNHVNIYEYLKSLQSREIYNQELCFLTPNILLKISYHNVDRQERRKNRKRRRNRKVKIYIIQSGEGSFSITINSSRAPEGSLVLKPHKIYERRFFKLFNIINFSVPLLHQKSSLQILKIYVHKRRLSNGFSVPKMTSFMNIK